eukprot:116188_1
MSLPVLLTFVRLFSAYSAHDYWASSETHCKCITNDMCMNVITCNITKITTSYVGNNDPTSWTYGTAESNTVSKSYISEPIEPFCHHKGTESLSNLALHEIYHPLSNMCKDYHCPSMLSSLRYFTPEQVAKIGREWEVNCHLFPETSKFTFIMTSLHISADGSGPGAMRSAM